jgi:hypothetical protein
MSPRAQLIIARLRPFLSGFVIGQVRWMDPLNIEVHHHHAHAGRQSTFWITPPSRVIVTVLIVLMVAPSVVGMPRGSYHTIKPE